MTLWEVNEALSVTLWEVKCDTLGGKVTSWELPTCHTWLKKILSGSIIRPKCDKSGGKI